MPSPDGPKVIHFLCSTGHASMEGGHAPPARTLSTSSTVRGAVVRFSSICGDHHHVLQTHTAEPESVHHLSVDDVLLGVLQGSVDESVDEVASGSLVMTIPSSIRREVRSLPIPGWSALGVPSM